MRTLFTLFTFCLSMGINAQNTSPYWSLSGNSNASASSKLGTTNTVPLRLVTNNAERLRIDSNGRVSIGTTTAYARLTAWNNGSTPATIWKGSPMPIFAGFGENTSGSGDMVLGMASNTANARGVYIARRSRGTLAAPTAVVQNDYLLSLLGSGYDGRYFQNPASIDFIVDGIPASGRIPTKLSFATGSRSADRKERLSIASNGDMAINTNQFFVQNATGGIGIGTIAPTPGYKLDVSGKIFAKGLYVSGYEGIDALGGFYGIKGTANCPSCELEEDFPAGLWGLGGSPDFGTGVLAQGFVGLRAFGNENGIEAFGNAIGISAAASRNDQGGGYAGNFTGPVYSSGGYYSASDLKLKQNIKDLTSALDLIGKLKPKSYEYKQDGTYNQMYLPEGVHYGLVAQEVELVLPAMVKVTEFNSSMAYRQPKKDASANVTQSGSAKRPEEKIEFKAVNYSELIPIMVKGIQEQDEKIQDQNEKIQALTNEVSELKAMVNRLISGGSASISLSNASLGDANPNPVNGTTLISYIIPQGSKTAHLLVTDMKGSVVKQILLNSRGGGRVTLNTAALAAGTYTYSLHVDGSKIDSKQLLVAR